MATIGQQLTSPETGWRRYDDSDSRILYSANWSTYSNSAYYNGSRHQHPSTSIGTINFKFYGTQLRIISSTYSTYSNNIQIVIDGNIIENFSESYASGLDQVLVYEKSGLQLGIHTIQMQQNVHGTYSSDFTLDAIDINSTGYLVHPILNQVSDINSMQIGDCIPCRYIASASSPGTITEIGSSIVNEIPVNGTSTPNGLFYLIKVDKGLLIADRIVQYSIPYDTLNSSYLVDGIPVDINGVKLLMHFDDSIIMDSCNNYISNNGVTLDANIKKFGKFSAYFNGTSTLAVANSSAFDFSDSDFTIDMQVKIVSTSSNGCLLSKWGNTGTSGNNAFALFYYNQTLMFAVSTDGTNINYSISYPLSSISDFTHIAVTKQGNTIYMFVNGNLVGNVNITGRIYNCSQPLYLMSYNGGNQGKNVGYIDELRIIKGKAMWISNFTPPSSLYTLSLARLRVPSGGISYSDINKQSITSATSYGAWPNNNEWDKYVVKSTLNGKITAGDNNIWHWSNIYTLCRECYSANNTYRSMRGYSTNAAISPAISSSGNSTSGIRPVLEYIDTSNTLSTNLYY